MSDNTPDLQSIHLYAENQQLRNQLDAKDSEIARIKSERDIYEQEYKQARTQIAERDATIARQDAFFKEWASGEDKFQEFGGWERIERLQEDHRAMKTMLEKVEKVFADNGWLAIRDLLQSLKEPNT